MSEFKCGDLVDYHSIIGGPVTLAGKRLRSDPFFSDSGIEVAFIEGKAGYVAVEALTPAEEKVDEEGEEK